MSLLPSLPPHQPATILVTGGAGFIGRHFTRFVTRHTDWHVVVVDALSYASDTRFLRPLEARGRVTLEVANIVDGDQINEILQRHQVSAVVHFAAESHVDRSIDRPTWFAINNVTGTAQLLEATLAHFDGLPAAARDLFRFIHISTDEVYGDLESGKSASPESLYRPNSPYAASKAGADHFVRAYAETYGLPTVITHSVNNYGPRQFLEKLIPLALAKLFAGEPIPMYGDGQQEREWLHVEDHCRGLYQALQWSDVGAVHHFGSGPPVTNEQLLRRLCHAVDRLGASSAQPSASLITPVADRPGHDRRYALDDRATRQTLRWRPRIGLDRGLAATARWYWRHRDWMRTTMTQSKYFGERLGRIRP